MKISCSKKKLNSLKKSFLVTISVLTLLNCSVNVRQNQTANPPNFIFVLTDDQTVDTIRALGNYDINTPHIDSLVKEGTSFTHVFNQGSWSGAVCAPSRKMINTGRHLHRTGYGPKTAKNDQFRSKMMGEILQEEGYETFITGKWHIDEESLRRSFSLGKSIFMPVRTGMSFEERGGQYSPLVADYDGNDQNPQNFQQRREMKLSSELFADAAIGYLESKERRNSKPFFIYLSFLTPHDPRQAPPEFINMYPPENIPIPPNMLPEHPFDEGDHNIRDEVLLAFPRTESSIKWYIAQYYAVISHLDAQIGRLLDALDTTGFRDNTYIIFTSDNGIANGQHGLLGKQNQYDHSVRVPFIITGPDIKRGEKKTGMFYIHSVLPTVLELAGVEIPNTVDSKSIVPLLREEKNTVHDVIYGSYKHFQRMVRTESHKLIYYPMLEKYQLFDLRVDPNEMNDISNNPENFDIVTTLMSELEQLKILVGDPLKNDEPEESYASYAEKYKHYATHPRRSINKE